MRKVGGCLWVALAALLVGCGLGSVEETAEGPDSGTAVVPSGPVSEAEALAVASSWPMAPECDGFDRAVDTIKAERVGGVTTSYVIRFQNGGFIIVGASHDVVPVIAYSCRAGALDAANPDADAYFRLVNRSIGEIVVEAGGEATPHPLWGRIASSAEYRAVGDSVVPMITTRWNQNGLYNPYTPTVDGTHTPLGCGALALGQLLRYHEFPAHGTGSNTYTWHGQLLRSEFARESYDWDLMPDQLTADTPAEQTEATTRFLAQVAVGLEMDFELAESGSFVTRIMEVLPQHYRYPSGGTRQAKSWFDDAAWIDLMKGELREARPVLYDGAGSAGHFFLLDGYDENDFFHVNWGWGGGLDGYYQLNALRPGSHDFTQSNAAEVGIAPERRGQGEVCGGYPGYLCAEGLACKHRVDTAGTCQPEAWCHADTGSADCADLPPQGTSGYYQCVDQSCQWTSGGGTQTDSGAGTLARSQWADYGPYDLAAGGTLTAVLTTQSGDADLYLRKGAAPTSTQYDCRPYLGGTQVESCTASGPGSVYVAVKGYASSSSFAIEVTYSGDGSQPPAPVCGNGILEGGEACDGMTLSCAALDPTFLGGTATCAAGCGGIDTSGCTMAVCGDGAVTGTEVCDSDTMTCTEYDSQYTVGNVYCRDDCRSYDTGECYSNICGNGILEKPEDCDGNDELCSVVNPEQYTSGTAHCGGDCRWDLSGCESALCGNLQLDPGEECDTNAPVQCSAVDGQYSGGLAICSDCRWNTGSCEYCGNGLVDNTEVCDGGTIDCTALDGGYTGGTAQCASTCDHWLVDACESAGPQQVTETEAGSATAGQWHHYGPFTASSGDLVATLTMTADVDLYVRRGAQPAAQEWDCRPYQGGATTESCSLAGPGVFYVSVQGYASSASFDLTVTYWVGDAPPPTTEEFTDTGTIGAGQWNHYGPFSAGAGQLEAVLSGTGDADLYVKKGSQPTSSSYDCRPYESTSSESCSLAGPGDFYVSVNGWASSSSYDLVVTYPAP